MLDPATLAENLDDPMWRLSNLYKIIIKGDDGEDDLVIQFKPNRAQRRFLANVWHRNIILKARQLGFTTLIAILWLDTALFSNGPIKCGIIAQDKDTAEEIFKDKVLFAYEHLPDVLRERFPLKTQNTKQLVFAHNGSSIKVATSVRGGTIHRLHVSEFGKICAKYPDKAREVITGSIPAVPKSGLLVIESTAEGQDGAFYTMTEAAKALHEKKAKLSEKDYKFHFFPWWQQAEYALSPETVVITEAQHRYFFELEAKIKRPITLEQRAWYVATLNSDFSGEAPLMWQEYPSTPEEAFQVSTEGCYYANQLAQARKSGRVLPTLPIEKTAVNTFWDLGRGDATSIWFHQRVGPENRFIKYIEGSGEDLDYYVRELQKTGFIFGRHYLPHDAEFKRLGESADTNRSIKEMLQGLMPGQRFETVPRITAINTGITATRNVFDSCWFSEEGCAQGLKRLGNYRKRWNKAMGCWSDEPMHDENSHGADAFRQFGQEADGGNRFPNGATTAPGATGGGFRRRGSAMAV